MQSNNSENKTILNADFHCHTFKSFDGFTTPNEILKACILKKINCVAITEHDRINKLNKFKFNKYGIEIIDGCEYTTNKGAHIIGLFVSTPIHRGSCKEVIEHIQNQNGIVLIPHPFKKKSGVCSIYKDPSFILKNSNMIELYNGGYSNTKEEMRKILEYKEKYDLKIVANSDSHKINQFGYYINQFTLQKNTDLKNNLKSKQPELFFDSNYKSPPRKIYKFQQNKSYQKYILKIPFIIKRYIKLITYLLSFKRIATPSYKHLSKKWK